MYKFLYGRIQRKHIKRNKNWPLNLSIRILLLIFFCNYFELEKKRKKTACRQCMNKYFHPDNIYALYSCPAVNTIEPTKLLHEGYSIPMKHIEENEIV